MKLEHKTLVDCFIASAKANRKRRCIADSRKSLDYGQTLTAAVALSRKINKLFSDTDNVAIMLPPSVGAVLANIAAAMGGKTVINLNYTLSAQIRATIIEQCGIKKIITSKLFLQKASLDISPFEPVFIEDLAAGINLFDKIKAYIAAKFLPKSFFVKQNKSGLATIIFSSGTTGIPKGVMLTNENIIANINSIIEAIKFTEDDNLCEVLPFFHSFGFTCGLWLPIVIGASAVYSVNPFDVNEVGTNAEKNKSTVMFAPPTFLLNYAKRIDKACFQSLRIVAAGAEKLKKPVADMFEERFGIRPLEGYGATELSPVATLNLAYAKKEGTAGRPLPSVEVKIVNPYDGQTLPTGQSGIIFVRGKNVMAGYFNMPQETQEVIRNGWYNTDDLGFIDEDGFLTITDRLARFSKIGGEMVPHVGVEDAYLEALGTSEQVVAVIALPDEKKGEQLIVLYLPQAGTAEKLQELINKSPLPNLWKPKPNNYIRIGEMPTLGTGKLDIGQLRKIAMETKRSKRTCDTT